MDTVDRKMKEPLYQKISGSIAKLIRNGVLKPGDKLPSVGDMIKKSRMTVNCVIASKKMTSF